MAELRFRLSLQSLARRNRRNATQLNSMAAEALTAARQLSSVYYYIPGSRHWPQYLEGDTPNREVAGEVNRLYARALEIEEAYRNAATRSKDPCLASLYNNLSNAKLAQARELQSILRRA